MRPELACHLTVFSYERPWLVSLLDLGHCFSACNVVKYLNSPAVGRAEGPGVDPLPVTAGAPVTPGAVGAMPGEAVDGKHVLISSWTTAHTASRNAS